MKCLHTTWLGTESAESALLKVKIREEIKGQIRVMLGPIWLVLFTAKKIFRLREERKEKKKEGS